MVRGGIEAAQGGFARCGLQARERETNAATFDARPHPIGTECFEASTESGLPAQTSIDAPC